VSALGRCLPALAWAGLIFWLSAQPKLPDLPFLFPGADKLIHAGFYGVLALLVLAALRPRARLVWLPIVVASLYGATDEWHQRYVPGRTADVLDWSADTAGAALAVGVWARRTRRDGKST